MTENPFTPAQEELIRIVTQGDPSRLDEVEATAAAAQDGSTEMEIYMDELWSSADNGETNAFFAKHGLLLDASGGGYDVRPAGGGYPLASTYLWTEHPDLTSLESAAEDLARAFGEAAEALRIEEQERADDED